MSQSHPFPWLAQGAASLSPTSALTGQQLRQLLCRDCDFYREDHEEELECSSFRMMKLLLKRGTLTPQQLAQATAPKA